LLPIILMTLHARLPIFILISCIFCNFASAQTWSGRDIEASVSNRANTSSLVIECINTGAIFLRILFRAYTNVYMNQGAVLRIGAKSFPVRVELGNDYAVLSDEPKTGISAELVTALKGGGELVADGPALRHLPVAQRSFPLNGGAKFIEEVQRDCGR
jgi:hypothetical protein